jgi:hypothetical protein
MFDKNHDRDDRNYSSGRSEAGRKSAQGGTGNPSPAAVEKYMNGVQFPTDREGLLSTAKKNGAPSDVMDVIQHFNEGEFRNVTDISKAYSAAH